MSDGELVADPRTVPTFFLGYLGEGVERREDGTWRIEDRGAGDADGASGTRGAEPWHTGDRVREDDDGYLWFEGRNDDVIVSAGYRIGPFEVESALVSHSAVAEAAAVAAPDAERGSVVRAVVVLRENAPAPSAELVRELQEHVKRETAPYKYPRIVEFAPELPKTASGKIKRAELGRARSAERNDRVDLDLRAPGQLRDADRDPRGRVLAEERRVEVVDLSERRQVSHVHGQARRSRQIGAGGGTHGL